MYHLAPIFYQDMLFKEHGKWNLHFEGLISTILYSEWKVESFNPPSLLENLAEFFSFKFWPLSFSMHMGAPKSTSAPIFCQDNRDSRGWKLEPSF